MTLSRLFTPNKRLGLKHMLLGYLTPVSCQLNAILLTVEIA